MTGRGRQRRKQVNALPGLEMAMRYEEQHRRRAARTLRLLIELQE